MATTVLPFVIPPRVSARPRERGEEARIIIFPGVRYEAVTDEDGADKPKRSRPSAKRKTKAR